MDHGSGGGSGGGFQILSLVEGLLVVALIVAFTIGSSRVGLAFSVAFAVLLLPTVIAYRRIQVGKDRAP